MKEEKEEKAEEGREGARDSTRSVKPSNFIGKPPALLDQLRCAMHVVFDR